MVMCFALCTSLVFAQTKHAPARLAHEQTAVQKASVKDAKTVKKSYKASIFNTKAGGDELRSWDFAADNDGYTTGNIGASQTIKNPDGSVVNMVQHTQNNGHASWKRIPDTTTATASMYAALPVASGGYPVMGEDFAAMWSPTADNGFMVMTMADQISGWGGSGAIGNFDSYIALESFSTTGAPAAVIKFFQMYRKFNSDKCYIDYSTDGSDWYQFEINVKNVDVSSNDALNGTRKILLPIACGNQANVSLRLRWVSDSRSGGAYGYWWFVDDISIVEAYDYDLQLLNSQYLFGGYHQIPEGMQVPLAWFASVQNIGINAQAAVTLGLNHLDANMSNASQFASLSYSNLASAAKVDTIVNGAAYNTNAYGWSVIDLSRINTPQAVLPSNTTGDNFVSASFGATNYTTTYLDTIIYQVNPLVADGQNLGQWATWAPDNGVLTPYSYNVDGMVQEDDNWYLSTGISDDNPSYTKPGYGLWNRFITGSIVPQNWVIRGMQLVAATQYSTDEANRVVLIPQSQIQASLYKDDEGSLYDSYVETGGDIYTTTTDDYNYYKADMTRVTRDDPEYKEYMLPGEYSVINITFPEQPALEPNTSYRLGYELVEGIFAVAGNTNRYVHHYDDDDDTTFYYVYYASDTMKDGTPNDMRKYGGTFHPGADDNLMQYDPDRGTLSIGTSLDRIPMIRMLVGPKATYPTFNVNVECEGFDELEGSGVFHSSNAAMVCGQTVEMIAGSNGSYIVAEAEAGYAVAAVIVDGDTVYTYIDPESGIEPSNENVTHSRSASSGYDVVYYNFTDAVAGSTHSIKIIVDDEANLGIKDISNRVNMNLYPNPANNNVKLTIAGVSGNVNCAILDMSGRVVYSQTLNAEVANNINLSNLAKGAYFVRITNKDFTKVEKLIVR